MSCHITTVNIPNLILNCTPGETNGLAVRQKHPAFYTRIIRIGCMCCNPAHIVDMNIFSQGINTFCGYLKWNRKIIIIVDSWPGSGHRRVNYERKCKSMGPLNPWAEKSIVKFSGATVQTIKTTMHASDGACYFLTQLFFSF